MSAGTAPSAGAAPSVVAVVGLGVMGGSLVRALRELPGPPRVLGASPDARDLESARRSGALDVGSADPAAFVGEADVVVYAAPLGATLALMEAHASMWRRDATITDVASLKAPVTEKVRALGAGARWVGSHPMAGAEASGFEASRADLYRGATVWLCEDSASPAARARIEALWRALGAQPAWTEVAAHDRLMTWASHLPQLAAHALALALEEAGVDAGALGPGGRDATRLAASAPSMWGDLLAAAAASDAEALRALARQAAGLADALDAGEPAALAERMERARRWRRGSGPEAVPRASEGPRGREGPPPAQAAGDGDGEGAADAS